MPRETERRVIELVTEIYDGRRVELQAPQWLLRPGKDECRARWPLIQSIYRSLTRLELPEVMPTREHRSMDAIFESADGMRILEVDEKQHFTAPRATTLRAYPADLDVAFDIDQWTALSDRGRMSAGGGWARACPPLFPDVGGRHYQRAFRDALADMLPSEHGWLPTLRISEAEVKPWIKAPGAAEKMAALLDAKLG